MTRYCFKPTWLPTLATLILLPGLLSLGFWQLHRAEQKRNLLAQYSLGQSQHPLPLNEVLKQDRQFDFLPVSVTGVYQNQRQVLLDNQSHDHSLGYHALTPLLEKTTGKIILVDRGWIPRVANQGLPLFDAVAGEQHLTGYLKKPSHNPFILGQNERNPGQWPRLIQQVEIANLQASFGVKLYPFILLLDASQPHGFIRDWHPVVLSPERHMGYAFQWFSLAGALLIIYLALNIKRKE
jgi:surfeit locus 1 family protein